MKDKKRMSVAMGFWVSIFVLISSLALAGPPDNFTAKMVTRDLAMPMAKMGNKTRVENVMISGLVTINLMDAKKTITLNTKNKTYFEKATEEKIPSLYDQRVVVEKKKVGSETVDGHPCIKYDAVFYTKDRPNEKFNTTLWEAQDLGGLPIRHAIMLPESQKMGGSGKIVSELKEIKVGAATAAMFEVPKDYKRVNSMNEVMGMGKPGDKKDMQEMLKQIQKMKKTKKPTDDQ